MPHRPFNRVLTTISALGLLQLVACGAPPSSDATQPSATAAATPEATATTTEVLDRHMKTFGAADLEGVMADYAVDAVMFTPGGPVKGTEALRKNFETVLAEWRKPGVKFDLKQRIVDGDGAYIYWNAETADNVYEGATDSFVIRDGKIASHFFAGKITPKP